MASRFRTEHYSTLRSDEKVRSVRRGGHIVRIAFPRGRRVTGSGRVLEVLHPVRETNPCRLPNPAELVVMMANPDSEVGTDVSEEQLQRHGLRGASEMCADFRGEPCPDIETHEEPEPRPQTLAQLGVLLDLYVKRDAGWKWGHIELTGRDIRVAANPPGTQIYFVGGNQKISKGELSELGVDNSKELIYLGEAMRIDYRAEKAHVNGIASGYKHDFGDVTGRRPRLMYDRRGPQPRLFLAGGEYVAKVEGIVN